MPCSGIKADSLKLSVCLWNLPRMKITSRWWVAYVWQGLSRPSTFPFSGPQREWGSAWKAEVRGFSETSASQFTKTIRCDSLQLNDFEPFDFIFLRYLSVLCNLCANKRKQKVIFKLILYFGSGLKNSPCSHTSYSLWHRSRACSSSTDSGRSVNRDSG